MVTFSHRTLPFWIHSGRSKRRNRKEIRTYQHLLWMGSDPLLTLLLFDWFGSNIIEGVGAMLKFSCSSWTSTPFRTREFLRNLRARSTLLRPETCPGCVTRSPTKVRKMTTLQAGNFILDISSLQRTRLNMNELLFSCLRKYDEDKWHLCPELLFLMPCPCTYKPRFYLLWDLQN